MTRQLRLGILLGVIGLCGAALKAQDKPMYYTPSDKILILGAVPQEITVFVSAMKDSAKKELWGIPYWQGEIEGKPVIVAITGIGKVYTGMTTTLFLTELKPRLVLMSGTGARINQQLRTGDVIVASTLYEHDYGSLTRNDMVYRPFNSPVNGAEVENKLSPSEALLKLADQAMATYRSPQVTANGATYEVKVRRDPATHRLVAHALSHRYRRNGVGAPGQGLPDIWGTVSGHTRRQQCRAGSAQR
jgi:adenosylhomocysteine nucleosidase